MKQRKTLLLFVFIMFISVLVWSYSRFTHPTASEKTIDFSGLEIITPQNVKNLELIAEWGIGKVFGVALSPNAESIAVGTNTGVYLFDSLTGEQSDFIEIPIAQKILDKRECIFARENIAFSPDGRYLAIADTDIKIWDLHRKKLHQTINPTAPNKWIATEVQFGIDGKQIVVSWAERKSFPCEVGKGSFGIYNLRDGREIFFQDFFRYVFNFEFSITEPNIAYFYAELEKGSDYSLIVIDVSSGKRLESNTENLGDFYEFDSDGRLLISYQTDFQKGNLLQTSRLIDINTGKEKGEFPYFVMPLPKTDNLLIYQDGVWQMQNRDLETICQFAVHLNEQEMPVFMDAWQEKTFYEAALGNILPLIFSLDGNTAIGYGWKKDSVWIWDLQSCSISRPLLFLPEPDRNLDFSQDGKYLLTESSSGRSFYRWNMNNGEAQLGVGDWESGNSPYDPVQSQDGKLEASLIDPIPRWMVLFRDKEKDSPLKIIAPPEAEYGLPRGFSPDGYLFVTMGKDGIIYVWGVKKP